MHFQRICLTIVWKIGICLLFESSKIKNVLLNGGPPPLPFQHLLPGMNTSPMFVEWQKLKSRIITNHVGSRLNDGIPREDCRVKYDDMHPFGQAMCQA